MIGMLEIIRIIALVIFLFLEGIRDLRKRKISMITVMVVGAIGIILRLGNIRENELEILGGILIGVILLLLAKLTREKIGYGDGWILVVTGVYLGFYGNMYLLLLSLFLASLVSIFLLAVKKANGKTELPFVSFMLPSYLLLLVIK